MVFWPAGLSDGPQLVKGPAAQTEAEHSKASDRVKCSGRQKLSAQKQYTELWVAMVASTSSHRKDGMVSIYKLL